jgi:predicted ferric reductase
MTASTFTKRFGSNPRPNGWQALFLRYPLVLWALYALTLYILLTALQNLWGGIELRRQTGEFWLAADTADPWYELGTSFGFWGMLYFGLNFVLAARWRWVEDLVGGLDRAYHLHALVGKAALLFLLTHLGVLALQAIPDQQVLAQYLVPFVDINYTLGMVGVVLLLVLVALTIWIKLPYASWLQTHKWMGVPYIAGSMHAILLQLDWYLILIMVAGCYAWLYRIVLHRRFDAPAAGTLLGVKSAGGVTELTIGLDHPVAAEPGQFVFFQVRASQAGLPGEAHPFSISAIDDAQTIRISAKALGDYTRRLPELRPGDTVAVGGPYGRFGARRSLVQGPMLWVAGGIGVTPFLSLLQQEALQPPGGGAPITFVWSVKRREEALYLAEIEQGTQGAPHVQFHLHVTEDDGYLTAEKLAQLRGQPGLASTSLFLCGPPAMMRSLGAGCRQLGLPRRSLITEEFAIR